MTTTPAQLSFALNNPGAPATVYISSDPSANKLTLVITSNVGASFAAGTVVPIEQAAEQGSGSLLYLDLSQLGLTEAEFNALTLDGSDWAFTGYYSSASSQLIGFTPTASVSLGNSSSISLSLDNFTLANQPPAPTAQLNVTYFRVGGVTQNNVPLMGNFAVAVTYPPDQNDQDLPGSIQASLYPNAVVNCQPVGQPLANNLILTFSPGPSPALIYAGVDTRFTLTFIYAEDTNGFGAMMTPAQAQPPGFAVTAGTNASGWTITPSTGNESPSWSLTPAAGQPVIGVGVESSVSFNITGLVTNFQPGPTVVLVAYENVPGYKNGTFSTVVQKLGHVEVENFAVSPAQSVLDESGLSTVTVSWTAYYATRLTLVLSDATSQSSPSNLTSGATQPKTIDVTGLSSYQTQISDSMLFELVAEGQSPDNLVDNRWIAYCTAYITPVIKSFSVAPQYIVEGSPNTCVISWDVNAPTGTQVTIASTVPGLPALLYPLSGSFEANFSEPQQLTLKAVPECGYPVASAALNVGSLPVITRFSANPSTITAGVTHTMSTISWTVQGIAGTTVTLTVNGSNISEGLSGSGSFKIYGAQTLSLTAVAPSGSPAAKASIQITESWGATAS